MSDLLTLAETADLLRVQPHTLYQWRWLGKGPRSLKVGGRVRYRRADVERWLAQHATDAESAGYAAVAAV